MASVRIVVPLRIVSVANLREHYMVKAKRTAMHRRVCEMALTPRLRRLGPWSRLRVTLTRLGARRLDGDNLQSALKAARDGIAKALGVDDGSDRVEWVYAQQQANVFELRIELEVVA